MSCSTWVYKWIDANGITHITTNYHEANEALHSRPNQFVFGSRIKPQSDPDKLTEEL